MCRCSLSIFILLTLCVAHNQSDTLPENRSADPNEETPSDTPADTNEGSDQEIDKSDESTERSVKNRRQKTFLRNPNYIKANKLFEEESKKPYIKMRYIKLPKPHPGFFSEGKYPRNS